MPEAQTVLDPAPTVVPAAEADLDDPHRPGADLARRLAEANANSMSNTMMGVPATMPSETEPSRVEAWRRRTSRRDTVVRVSPFGEAPVAAKAEPGPKPATPRTRRAAPRTTAATGRSWLRFVLVILVAAIAAVALRTYVVAPYYIPSASMETTLHGCPQCNNDHVLVDKLSYKAHAVHRGDVVVFHRPTTWQVSEKLLIKRVIGLPGDILTTQGGEVYVNGRALLEPYVDSACTSGTTSLTQIQVPAGQVFVMGDNRCDSEDSRVFGPVPTSAIVGRAFVIVWPLPRIHWL